jgi:hypothetical protein
MPFQGHIITPKGLTRKPGVKSILNSRRELGSTWRDIQQGAKRDDSASNIMRQLKTQLDSINPLGMVNDKFHPFQIYQFPKSMRAFQNDNDFARFKVRLGYTYIPDPQLVIGSEVLGSDNATGLQLGIYTQIDEPDNAGPFVFQIPPDDDSLIEPLNSWNEALVETDGTETYFWISLTAWNLAGLDFENPIVCYGTNQDDILSATELYTGATFDETWASFPANDPYHIFIGSIWFANGSPVINQVLFDNVDLDFATGYGTGLKAIRPKFCGLYSGSTNYFYGDTVTEAGTDFDDNPTVNTYIYAPPDGTAFPYFNGPISGVDPNGNTPDPWSLISQYRTS